MIKLKIRSKRIAFGISQELGFSCLNNSAFFYLRIVKVYFNLWK